ncbi:MAG: translation initiation factor, partial [Arenibacter sp.]|nr:translation initiation factor [Arenibacter sp.]
MDLKDQLKNLFPDHQVEESEDEKQEENGIWLQDDPIICKYEKRKGKPITILEGYNGADSDFKKLAKELKTKLSVGGSVKGDTIIIQGDFRDKI